MNKAELLEQIDAMTEEEAAEVKLIWPDKATPIEEASRGDDAELPEAWKTFDDGTPQPDWVALSIAVLARASSKACARPVSPPARRPGLRREAWSASRRRGLAARRRRERLDRPHQGRRNPPSARRARCPDRSGVRVFCLTNRNMRGEEQTERFVSNRHRILRQTRKPGPYIYGVYERV